MIERKKSQQNIQTSPLNIRLNTKRSIPRALACSGSVTTLVGHSQSMKPSMDKDSVLKDNEYDEDKLDDDCFNEAKKRRRKSNVQLRILKNELDSDENWSKEKIFKVSKLTGLSESQVYKWCWDQKKKKDDFECKKVKIGDSPDSHSSTNQTSALNNSLSPFCKDFKQSSIKIEPFAETINIQKLTSMNNNYKAAMNNTSQGIYGDYFDDEKENYDIENLMIKNKPIHKLAITNNNNSISNQKYHNQQQYTGNQNENSNIACSRINTSINDLKRDSLVYKDSYMTNGNKSNLSANCAKNLIDKNDFMRGMQRRSAIKYR